MVMTTLFELFNFLVSFLIVDDEQIFNDIKGMIVPVLAVLTVGAAAVGGARVSWAFMQDDPNAKTMLRRYIWTISLMSVLTGFCFAIKNWAQAPVSVN